MEHWREYLSARSEQHAGGGDCVLWLNACDSGGYGVTNVKFMGDTRTKFIRAHRLAYIVRHNLRRVDIKNKSVSHLCGNSRCVNADHLHLEPQSVNNARKLCKNNHKTCIGHNPHPRCTFT